jgi:hypothetical protein
MGVEVDVDHLGDVVADRGEHPELGVGDHR